MLMPRQLNRSAVKGFHVISARPSLLIVPLSICRLFTRFFSLSWFQALYGLHILLKYHLPFALFNPIITLVLLEDICIVGTTLCRPNIINY